MFPSCGTNGQDLNMADTQRELVINNNVIFMDEESEGQKNLQKRRENDADEVRELSKLIFSVVLRCHAKHISSHKRFYCHRLTRSLKVFQS